MAEVLKKNPLFVNEPVYAKELESKAEQILKQYALGQLIAAGDNRFLSGDLLEFLTLLLDGSNVKNASQRQFYAVAMRNRFAENSYTYRSLPSIMIYLPTSALAGIAFWAI